MCTVRRTRCQTSSRGPLWESEPAPALARTRQTGSSHSNLGWNLKTESRDVTQRWRRLLFVVWSWSREAFDAVRYVCCVNTCVFKYWVTEFLVSSYGEKLFLAGILSYKRKLFATGSMLCFSFFAHSVFFSLYAIPARESRGLFPFNMFISKVSAFIQGECYVNKRESLTLVGEMARGLLQKQKRNPTPAKIWRCSIFYFHFSEKDVGLLSSFELFR